MVRCAILALLGMGVLAQGVFAQSASDWKMATGGTLWVFPGWDQAFQLAQPPVSASKNWIPCPNPRTVGWASVRPIVGMEFMHFQTEVDCLGKIPTICNLRLFDIDGCINISAISAAIPTGVKVERVRSDVGDLAAGRSDIVNLKPFLVSGKTWVTLTVANHLLAKTAKVKFARIEFAVEPALAKNASPELTKQVLVEEKIIRDEKLIAKKVEHVFVEEKVVLDEKLISEKVKPVTPVAVVQSYGNSQSMSAPAAFVFPYQTTPNWQTQQQESQQRMLAQNVQNQMQQLAQQQQFQQWKVANASQFQFQQLQAQPRILPKTVQYQEQQQVLQRMYFMQMQNLAANQQTYNRNVGQPVLLTQPGSSGASLGGQGSSHTTYSIRTYTIRR